jgi:hypothetical protein
MHPLRTAKSKMSALAALAMIATFAIPELANAASAVSTLLGTWSGNGRITYTDGTSEGIHCNAYYTGGGNELHMAIQCKSDKNQIHIRSQLHLNGSRASGSWEERTFNASGTASGSIGSSSMSLHIEGSGLTGTMSVSFSKSSHSVNISTHGIAMSGARMSFSRR